MNPTPTARTLALDLLTALRERRGFLHELIDDLLPRVPGLAPADRRLMTTLALGVVRRAATLDALIRPFVQRPWEQVEPVWRDVLRLGAYQLTLLNQIPPHAAVHETVNLAEHVGRPQAKGFLNGILRRVAELPTDDFAPDPWTNTLPTDDGRYRQLTQEVLPDPEEAPQDYLALGFSLPEWFAERLLARYDEPQAFAIGFHYNRVPPLWLRVNLRQISREAYQAQLAAAGFDSAAGEPLGSLQLLDPATIRDLPGYAEGLFSVQDVTSQRVGLAVQPRPGERILDLCAAPGGKATHLAELMQDHGEILACDNEPTRLETVGELARRLGIQSLRTQLLSPSAPAPQGPFDAVLIDAPCSNTGVLGRRPEVRHRLQPHELPYLVRLQEQLLRDGLARVRPGRGARLLYATCSIEPEENEELVRKVLAEQPGWQIDAEERSTPGQPSDGGYWARLTRVDPGP